MTIKVHVSNVDMNELWALVAKMSPVLAKYGEPCANYSQNAHEPYIACNSEKNQASLTSIPIITVSGYTADQVINSRGQYVGKKGAGSDLQKDLAAATGLQVLFV